MINKVRRNEIYLANLGKTVGSEERGVRPVLIIQNDIGNKHSPTTIIIPITKRIEKQESIPTHIKTKPFGKMKYEATIMAEQIKVIDKRRLIKRIDVLPEEYVNLVNEAISIATNLQEIRTTSPNRACFFSVGGFLMKKDIRKKEYMIKEANVILDNFFPD